MATDIVRAPQGSHTIPLLPSAARTVTPNIQQVNADDRGTDCDGLLVFLNVTAVTATGTLLVTIDGVDPVSGATYNILTGASVTGTGLNVYRVHPNLLAVTHATAQDEVPRVFNVTVTHGPAVAMTYSLTVEYTG